MLTTLVSWGHKIPVIGKIINLFSLGYGRTTWWHILARIRKVFVVFNAIIGVYIVYKIAGFTTEGFFTNLFFLLFFIKKKRIGLHLF